MVKVEWTKYNGATYKLGYGNNTEYLTASSDISKNSNRFVYEILHMKTETEYAIAVTATGGDLGATSMISNVILIKPKASPTP